MLLAQSRQAAKAQKGRDSHAALVMYHLQGTWPTAPAAEVEPAVAPDSNHLRDKIAKKTCFPRKGK
jgi:hypothetical protein